MTSFDGQNRMCSKNIVVTNIIKYINNKINDEINI